jgi:hypothetical protein
MLEDRYIFVTGQRPFGAVSCAPHELPEGLPMRCFNHNDREAVGHCKACCKGLCTECAADLGFGLACKGSHEKTVELGNTIFEIQTRSIAAAPRNVFLAPAFLAVMGIVLLWFGYTPYQGLLNLPFVMGFAFLGYGVAVFVRGRSIYTRKNG